MRKLLASIAVPALVALTLLVTLPAFGAAPPVESLGEYARKSQRRHAYGIYVRKVKVGWLIEERKLGKHEGKDVLVRTVESSFVQTYEGVKKVTKEKKTTLYALEGEGTLLFHENQSWQGKKERVRRAVRKDKGMLLSNKQGARTTERLVPLPKDTLADERKFEAWLPSAKKGNTFVSWSTDWDSQAINAKETFTFQEKKSVVWGGQPTSVYAGTVTSKGMRINTEMLGNGVLVAASLGEGMTVRMEPEAVVKKLGGGIDLAASFIVLDRELGGSGREVQKLTLEVEGLGGLALPQSHRQRTRAGKNKAVIVELERDFRVAKGAPLTEAERKEHTRATPRVQSDHEAIRKLAQKIVGDEKGPLEKATLLSKWAHRKVRYDFRYAWADSALAVLDNRAGVCADYALLYVALARAVGLPAREVTGLAYVNPAKLQFCWSNGLPGIKRVSKPQLGWHAWAEIHDGSQWVTIDPTMNQVYVVATHVKFSEGDDSTWKNVAGKLKIKVVKVEMAKKPVAMGKKR